jgi:hypothetical protein
MRALASFSDDDGKNCYPSLETLAMRSGCKRTTLWKVLKEFKKRRWIKVKHTGRVNIYEILAHGCVVPTQEGVFTGNAGKAPNSQERSSRSELLKFGRRTSEVQIPNPRSSDSENNSYQRLSSKNSSQSLSSSSTSERSDNSALLGRKGAGADEEDDGNFLEGNKKGREGSSFVTQSGNTAGDERRFPPAAHVGAQDEQCTAGVSTTPVIHSPGMTPPLTIGCLVPEVWRSIIDKVKKRRPLITHWVEAATPIRCESTSLTLGFGPGMELDLEALSRPNNHRLIEDVISSLFGGGTWQVNFELREDLPAREPVPETPEKDRSRRPFPQVNDNNAHSVWEMLRRESNSELEQISKDRSDRRRAGMARKVLQQRRKDLG